MADAEEGRSATEFSRDQCAMLLALARRSITSHLERGKETGLPAPDPELSERRGAFVTLANGKRLRGCIGYSEPLYPLQETVARCAVAAATEDYRFPSVTLEELPDLTISISVLSPLEKLASIDDLEPGRHGLMISGRGLRVLLLPQVAAERGWDRQTFLAETCRKAGLPPDAWRDKDTEVFVFEAQVFSE